MNASSRILTSLLLAGGLAAATPVVVAGPGYGAGVEKHCSMDKKGGHHGMKGQRGGEGRGQIHFLRGLELTEAQQDKIFEIRHDQAPAKRARFKDMRDLRKQQKALLLSGNYDSGKMKKLIEAETRLLTEHRIKRADTQHKIYQVLTPEQRQQITERMEQRNQARESRKAS